MLVACKLLIANCQLFSQSYSYQSQDNPYYWKNRKPFEGYWQQDVHYKIKASLDDKTNIVDASEELTYWNNSPDELNFVYFHLYSNAQVKDSYLSDLYKNNNTRLKYGKYQREEKGTEVNKISIDGIDLKTELDNTILKVWLPEPLKSGKSITLKIDFKTYFDSGTIRNRMKMFNAFGYKHYDLVHWYPRISVYDRKFGWDTDQHMDHEFYGNFGTYDVDITFPNHYVLDATGNLLNREEVLPVELRQKLDIKNFKDKKWNEAPSEIIKPDGTTKTWKFSAINVHDFALTADPTYRIGEAEWQGIKCISLAQEPHASRWQNAAEYAAKIIEVNSQDFGMYAYPKMIVADAEDGMEYPMLTLDGGQDPGYRGLLVHEISHNWFYGMVGNNETYRAFLDEGFTQFLTSWTISKIDGEYGSYRAKTSQSKYVKKYSHPELVRNNAAYNKYLMDAIKSDETTLNTHSDGFKGAIRHGGGYGQVYYKTATMLYSLQYVLGDELFLKAMQHYFNQWKMCHPYPEDFRNSIIQYTHVDLNWFFDQWIETSKTIDYKIKSVKRVKEKSDTLKKDYNNYMITFERRGRMQMPIDFDVIVNDSVKHSYHIPNTWFEKKTDATILPRWIGWDKVATTYEANVSLKGELEDVVIDPTMRLADVNMLNNSFEMPVAYHFDSKVENTPDWTKYEIFARPEIWYNGYDGLKGGGHVNGSYMNYMHVFDATIWYNTGLLQNNIPASASNKFDFFNFRINYSTALDRFMKNSTILLSVKSLEGLNAYSAGYERRSNSGKSKLLVYVKSMYRAESHDLNYLLYPQEWQVNKLNNTLNMVIEHNYNYKRGTGNILLSSRTNSIASDYAYASVGLTAVNKNNLGKISINTRTFLQYGTGSNWASESSLYLAGANPEELMENKYTRSQGFFDPSWAGFGTGTNYFQSGGGLNLRGYAGYLAPQKDKDGNIIYTYKGTTGAALNVEVELDKLLKLNRSFIRNTFKLTPYLFGDAGTINYNNAVQDLLLSDLRVDAGIGFTLGIMKWGPLQTAKPLIIRFDVPLFLNRAPATDDGFVQFRWVIGINRAF